MSGIAGIIDPHGVSVDELLDACRSVPWRGVPRVWSDGIAVLATLDADDAYADLYVSDDAVTVVDGRLDATLDATTTGALRDVNGPGPRFDRILGRLGPDALDRVAADFAIARWDRRRASLLLTRDACAMRPLVYASQGRRLAFASDPEILIALGLAAGSLDREPVASYLAGRDWSGERTAFVGVLRVLGGRWMEFANGTTTTHRWFCPEDIAEREWTIDSAAEELRPLLVDAVRCRAAGQPTAVLLSGGRDSSSVALAAGIGGLSPKPTCITYVFDADLPCNEADLAREVAAAAGLACSDVIVPSEIANLDDVGDCGTPITFPVWPQLLAARDAVGAIGARVMLDGEGGEPLFAAGPVAALDELRARHFRSAVDVARAFPARWRFGYPAVGKALARAVAPKTVMTARDRLRRVPRGVVGAPPVTTRQPRSAREELVQCLVWWGETTLGEMWDRVLAPVGTIELSPLADRRIINLALSLPAVLRAPVPVPKPLLARAWLGDLAATRRKTDFGPYKVRVTERSAHRFPDTLGSDSLLWRQGYVDAAPPGPPGSPTWTTTTLHRITLEGWLRRQGGDDARRDNGATGV